MQIVPASRHFPFSSGYRGGPPTRAEHLRRVVPAGHLTQPLRRVAPPPPKQSTNTARQPPQSTHPVVLFIVMPLVRSVPARTSCRIALDVHPESCWSSHYSHSAYDGIVSFHRLGDRSHRAARSPASERTTPRLASPPQETCPCPSCRRIRGRSGRFRGGSRATTFVGGELELPGGMRRRGRTPSPFGVPRVVGGVLAGARLRGVLAGARFTALASDPFASCAEVQLSSG